MEEAELERGEVEQIIASVCHPSSYHMAELVEQEGRARLALPHLETWKLRGSPSLQGQVLLIILVPLEDLVASTLICTCVNIRNAPTRA